MVTFYFATIYLTVPAIVYNDWLDFNGANLLSRRLALLDESGKAVTANLNAVALCHSSQITYQALVGHARKLACPILF